MALEFQNVGAAIDQAMFKITQSGLRAQKHAVELMRKEAEEIRALAEQYAPYDIHSKYAHLRDSIKVTEDRTGSNYRTVVYVYVDGNNIGNSGVPIFEYAWLVHEGLLPYGDGSLRGRSRMGYPTGGKYLERAFRDGTTELVRKAAVRVRRAIEE